MHDSAISEAFTAPSSDLPATWENAVGLLESDTFTQRALPAFLRESRWFGGKAHPLREVRTVAALPIGESAAGRLVLLEASYHERASEIYLLPLQLAAEAPEKASVVARFRDGVLCDALHDASFRHALFDLILSGKSIPTPDGEIVGICGDALAQAGLKAPPSSRALAAEQSNSAITYDGFFLKLYRKPEAGQNPDAELIRFLSERQHFKAVPTFCGAIEHRPVIGEARTLALLVGHVTSHGDAWAFTLESLARHYAQPSEDGDFPARVQQLGQRTAEMHLALAGDAEDPEFAPEPFTPRDQRTLCEAAKTAASGMLALLAKKHADIPESHRPDADALLARGAEIFSLLDTLENQEIRTVKTRHHGDYHLGQVLNTGDDFVIIDFEGEPARSLAERRMKRSPLRDVAGMLRSFHYAAHSALPFGGSRDAAETWAKTTARTFLKAWLDTAKGAVFLPENPAALEALLAGHLIEKAIYEINYELNHRPDWVFIPVRGVLQILDDQITS